jgi:hypothetical protein
LRRRGRAATETLCNKGKPTAKKTNRTTRKTKTASVDNVITYQDAKKALEASMERQDKNEGEEFLTDTAADVLDAYLDEDKAAEQAFVAEHIFRKAIEDALPSGLAGFDLDGKQIYANKVFC